MVFSGSMRSQVRGDNVVTRPAKSSIRDTPERSAFNTSRLRELCGPFDIEIAKLCARHSHKTSHGMAFELQVLLRRDSRNFSGICAPTQSGPVMVSVLRVL